MSKKKTFAKHFYLYLFFFVNMILPKALLSQQFNNPYPNPTTNNANVAPTENAKDIIQVDKSNYLEYYSKNGIVTQKLVGDVWLHQDSVFMYCDSALIENRTKLRAFGHVVIQQGKDVSCFSDSLIYDGVAKNADLYANGDVILKSGNQTLYAWRTLNYNLTTKIGTYKRGGKLISDKTSVFSREGEYFVSSKEAFFRKKVFISDKDFTIKTDTLQYNMGDKTALFLAPTVINQEKAKIYCERGYYDFNAKNAEFFQNAQYEKEKSKATADTIKYDGNLKDIKLIGKAIFQDSAKIATADLITYNDSLDVSTLEGNAVYDDGKQRIVGEKIAYNNKNSSFKTNGRSTIADSTQILTADFVDFDKEKGKGIAKGKVVWQDTVNRIAIRCDEMEYEKKQDYIKTRGGRPLLINVIDRDTMYLSADTLVSRKDTTLKNNPRLLRAYHDVRIFKSDMQAVCDSLLYSEVDSTFRLLKAPLMWSDSSQFSADTIHIILLKNKIDRMNLLQNGFIITEVETNYFDQIKGKNISAFFSEGKIKKMRAKENAESIYYATDEKDEYIGVNKVASAEMMVFWGEKNKVENIKFFSQPIGTMTPVKNISPATLRLDGFDWQPKEQPKNIEDLLKQKPKRKINKIMPKTPEKEIKETKTPQRISERKNSKQ